MNTISNEHLTVVINPQGAEIQSITDRAGHEYLWQGDPTYWDRRSPILFPAVGGLWNGTYRHGGKSYSMPKHGFMRDCLWQVAEAQDDSLTLVYNGPQNDEERNAFPWRFALTLRYSLSGTRLEAHFTVDNLSEDTMYFQMGGHPGFALPDFAEEADIDGYMRLEGEVEGVLRATEQGCVGPEHFDIPRTDDGLVPLSVSTFAHEALIFDRAQIKAATLLDKQRRPRVRIESDAPVWLFWAPQGVHTPFVCVEPWYGLCDRIGYEGDIAGRPYINRLDGGGTWNGGYSIEIVAEAI